MFRQIGPLKIGNVGLVVGSVVIVFATFVGCAAAAPRRATLPASSGTPATTSVAEPSFAAAFVAALERGDEETADQVASPLYRLEWKRRGLSPADRRAVRDPPGAANRSPPWLAFTYVGGGVSPMGFRHLLYRGQSLGMSHPVYTAWRVDTEPSGRVVWAEMVFLFSPDSAAVTPLMGRASSAAILFPDYLARFQPRLVAGLRAGAGREAYYAVSIQPTSTQSPNPSAGSIKFFGVDAEGNTRPGAWSYGTPNPGLVVYGQAPRVQPLTPEPGVAQLEQLYLAALP